MAKISYNAYIHTIKRGYQFLNDSYRVEKIYHIYSFNVSNFKVHSVVIEVRMKKKSVTVFNFI